jgi:aspartate/tyrosine/aromatic aminotransferase
MRVREPFFFPSPLPSTVAQCNVLQDRFHVYLVDTGRINISGLNERYSMYFARSLDEVVREAIGQQQ